MKYLWIAVIILISGSLLALNPRASKEYWTTAGVVKGVREGRIPFSTATPVPRRFPTATMTRTPRP